MVVKFLLLYNEDRGRDSMGFYSKESGIVKKQGKPKELLTKAEFKIPETNQFIGHVRSFSSGGVSDDNAHPFQHGNIVLVMNGTLSNHWDLCRKNKINTQEIHVDSDALCALLNQFQNKLPLTEIDGSCACVYIDVTTDKMYVYRNIERPLFRGVLDEGMYISSTKESLEAVECTKIEEFKADNLYEIQNGEILKTYKVKRYIKPAPETAYWPNQVLTLVYDPEKRKHFQKLDITYSTKDKLVGKWLRPKATTVLLSGVTFHPTQYYQMVEDETFFTSNMDLLMFHPEMGKAYNVSMFKFDDRIPLFEKNEYVFAIKDIIFKETQKLFCKKGHMLLITSIHDVYSHMRSEKTIICRIADNIQEVEFKGNADKFIRAITDEESDAWWVKYCDEANKDWKEKNKPVIITPAPQIAPKPSDEEIYRKQLDNTLIPDYDALIDVITENMDDIVDDLSDSITDDYEKKLLNKMKILIEYFKVCDAGFVELSNRGEGYGG